jgi:sporulation protein YlmC with PRC-barrel domain
MGDKFFAIPWPSLELSGDYKSFVLNVDKDRLKSAQGFDKSQWPNFADPQFATTTYKYYNQEPYWRERQGGAMASDGGGANEYRTRWYEPTSVWQKASDLTGKEVRGSDNANLGDIKDLAIDPEGGRILYGILSHRGRLFAVPWTAMTLTQDGKYLVLNVDKNQLTDQVSFTSDNWPNLIDARWSGDIYRHYHVEPYWIENDHSRNP